MAKAYDVVRTFEEEIASWAGAKYGVAVESCCSAIFLSLQFNYPKSLIGSYVVEIPKRTYPGVAMAIVNCGLVLQFHDEEWEGVYSLRGTDIIDGALRFRKDMYEGGMHCLSFHSKKLLPIGRGGMILTDSGDAYEWLKMARFDGRREVPLLEDNADFCGWNMYMTPEQASRGLTLFESIKNKDIEDLKVEEQNYPDLSQWKCFKEGR